MGEPNPSSTEDDEHGFLICHITIETLSPSDATPQNSKSFKQAKIYLGRNEFRDIIIKIEAPGRANRLDVNYRLADDIKIYKKFIKEGKASILVDGRHRLLLSNCPPQRLLAFLRCLLVKHMRYKQVPRLTSKQRARSDKMPSFTDISPLTAKDIDAAHTNNQKSKANVSATPVKSGSDNGKHQSKRTLADVTNTPGKPPEQMVKKPSGSDKLIAYELNNKLTAEQTSVISAVKSGRSIFFTGSAGTGKSHLLKKIVGVLPPQGTVVTASTGVAACMIGGSTLHAFAGIGSGTATVDQCYQLASRKVPLQAWRRCRTLIIDEVSMVSADFFDKLEQVARYVRGSDLPFGGIQLVLCGDFLQLPPVIRGEDRENKPVFCFQSKAWRKCINLTLELTEVKRQQDPKFVKILQLLRMGRCPSWVSDALVATANKDLNKGGIKATKLCTHKEDVDVINARELGSLPGDVKEFPSIDSEPSVSHHVDKVCSASKLLTLKIGAQVMLIKNLDIGKGLVNGARGVVTGFDLSHSGCPVVQFMNGEVRTVTSHRWLMSRVGGLTSVYRQQIPLRLAWAFSVHKSQGMTLDCVELSLSRVFECGQAYVALSRARSLHGLRVLDFESTSIRANRDVVEFYKNLSHQNKSSIILI